MKRWEDNVVDHSSKVDHFNALLGKKSKRSFLCYCSSSPSSVAVFSASVHLILEDFLLLSAVRLELETRLAALEQQRALQDAADHAQKEEWEERLRSAQQGEESARRELQNLRSVLY